MAVSSHDVSIERIYIVSFDSLHEKRPGGKRGQGVGCVVDRGIGGERKLERTR